MAHPDEKSIFLSALEKDTPDERNAFLTNACAGKPQMRAEVEYSTPERPTPAGPTS